MDMRGSWITLNLYAIFACSGSPSIFILHCMCALILFPSGSRPLIGSIFLFQSFGLFIHKEFKVAPLSAIESKFLTRRLWEIFIFLLLVLLIISPALSRPQALGLPYRFPPMLSDFAAFSLCPSFLYRHILLSWPMSTQFPCVQQYPPTSRRCFPFTHLDFFGFAYPRAIRVPCCFQ